MPNDYLTLNALVSELDNGLTTGKIEKITQPERDELVFTVRKGGVKRNLVVSCYAETPRIHFTTIKKENPLNAPTFLMHMRKLIGSGYINGVRLVNYDRIVAVDILSKNEMKDTVQYSLIFEMMGRYSNTMLINDKSVIIDAIKQVGFDTATKRTIIAGAKYEPPTQSKILPFDYQAIEDALKLFNGKPLERYVTATISGLSPISAREIIARASLTDRETLNSADICRFMEEYKGLYTIFNTDNFKPCASGNDYFITPYQSAELEYYCYSSLSEAIESRIAEKDRKERHRQRAKHLIGAVKKYKSRNVKKLEKANEKLEECTKIDTYLKYGELINCNLFRMKKGDEKLVADDYYSAEAEKIDIPLDPLLSPQENARQYFKRYQKLKRTKEVIVDQIEETRENIEYADSITASLETSAGTAELLQIEEELVAVGALRKLKNKPNKSTPKAEPHAYEYEGFGILVGKNNYQNDKLTFKTANGGDLWLHALGYHGSHVIVFAEARAIPDNVILFAAELAAYYSSASSDKITVDYTFRKNVKRNPSKKLGMVTYSSQNSIVVTPNEHKEFIKS